MLPEEMTTKEEIIVRSPSIGCRNESMLQVSILPEQKAYAGYAQIEGMIFQVSVQLPMEFIPTKSTLQI